MRREMSALRVTLEPVTRKRVAPGDAAIEVVVVNSGDKPEFFHEYQAQHASLVLQLEDPSGKRLLLPPPPPPDERDLGPPSSFAPGQSIRLRYVGLVDARRGFGRYRVRWFSRDEGLGGSREAPLESEWIALEVGRSEVSQLPPRSPFAHLVFAAWTLVRSSVLIVVRDILRLLCRAVLGQEVDLQMTETISNATPSAWNGTYAWNARFHVQVDQRKQRIVVTIRIRLSGINETSAAGWTSTVGAAWSNRFKDCAVLGCASNGFPILLALQYVQSGEHHVVSLSPNSRTAHMNSWGLSDSDQAHEVGHMLGNKEEYFTVDGVDYGPGRQPGGNIMNNPANPPVATHYRFIQYTADKLLGINYSLSSGSTRPVNVPCSYI